jgi:hypothetical protein
LGSVRIKTACRMLMILTLDAAMSMCAPIPIYISTKESTNHPASQPRNVKVKANSFLIRIRSQRFRLCLVSSTRDMS